MYYKNFDTSHLLSKKSTQKKIKTLLFKASFFSKKLFGEGASSLSSCACELPPLPPPPAPTPKSDLEDALIFLLDGEG